MVTISNLRGLVCLAGNVACTDASGISQADCNGASTGECNCVNECGGAPYGALLRDNCLAVSDGSFTSESDLLFFVNRDCNDANNAGQFYFDITF